MNSKQLKQDTMNIFSKRTSPTIKNIVPLTLSMIQQIDPNTRKLDDLIEVHKVTVQAKVQTITHRLGGKMEIELLDQSDNKEGVVHLYRPKFAVQETDIVQNELYTFVCFIKADHGQIVLNGITFKKVKSQDEVNTHHYKITLADLYRQKRRKQLENEANNLSKQNEYNEFDI